MSQHASLADYNETRTKALRELDMEFARNQMGRPASSDEVLLIAMHKARYECKDLEPEYRHLSARWLRHRGYKRYGGGPLLPEGELPA